MNKRSPEWKLEDGSMITLLSPSQLKKLAPNTLITSILGESRRVEEPELGPPDDDTRGGWTAWGVPLEPETAGFLKI